METYIGIRIVKAEPMTSEEAGKHGYKLPETIEDNAGYGVINHLGKKRWYSNEAFEKRFVNNKYWLADIKSHKFRMSDINDYFENGK